MSKPCPYCRRQIPEESAFCLYCMETLIETQSFESAAPKHRRLRPVSAAAVCLVLMALSAAVTAFIVGAGPAPAEMPTPEPITAQTSLLPTDLSGNNLFDKKYDDGNEPSSPVNEPGSFVNARLDREALVLQYTEAGNAPWDHATLYYRLPVPITATLDDTIGWDIDVFKRGNMVLYFSEPVPLLTATFLTLAPTIVTSNRAETDFPAGSYSGEATLRQALGYAFNDSTWYRVPAYAAQSHAEANGGRLTIYAVGFTVVSAERKVDAISFNEFYIKPRP